MRTFQKQIGLILFIILALPVLYKSVHALTDHEAAAVHSHHEVSEVILSSGSSECLICSFEYAQFTNTLYLHDCLAPVMTGEKLPIVSGHQIISPFTELSFSLRAPPQT